MRKKKDKKPKQFLSSLLNAEKFSNCDSHSLLQLQLKKVKQKKV